MASWLGSLSNKTTGGFLSSLGDAVTSLDAGALISGIKGAFHGIKDHGDGYRFEELTPASLPMRDGCLVTLYQDAHCSGDMPPPIFRDPRMRTQAAYKPEDCFDEIYRCIVNAKHFVYITGWSVDTKISLVRRDGIFPEDDPTQKNGLLTMGELLKYKAEQGVRVLVHCWNEALSIKLGGIHESAGVMGTCDEETKHYFEGTPVEVVLSYRDGPSADTQFLWTHHQKTVIVDAAVPAQYEHQQVPNKRPQQQQPAGGLAGDLDHDGDVDADDARLAKFDLDHDGDVDSEDMRLRRQRMREERRRRQRLKAGGRTDAGDGGGAQPSAGRIPGDYDGDGDVDARDKRLARKDVDGDGDVDEDDRRLRRKKKQRRKRNKRGQKSKRDRRLERAGRSRGAPGDDGDDDSEEDDEESGEEEEEEEAQAVPRARGLQRGAAPASGQRRIVAFVGGLDLTNGRWDTPSHTLYRSLAQEHASDFLHGWCISSEWGPREPWHDIHAKLEGPVARDVLANFEQRWQRQAADRADKLLRIKGNATFLSEEQEAAVTSRLAQQKHAQDVCGGSWEVQILRSIDSFGATISGVENSIQHGYIAAIRGAEHYLYFENQYFMGSSQYWLNDNDVSCHNLIPFEIARRVCDRIQAKQRFAAYIVIPMYPEGYPETGAIQEQLRWQWNSMCMMYKMIGNTLREEGVDAHPTDYLNFYCVGMREVAAGSEAPNLEEPPADENELEHRLYQVRRLPIYVHSKLMIADDDFVVVGSANINERSMAGDRDTEICMAASQEAPPTVNKRPRGVVHQFRMSLFAEHTNESVAEHLNPEEVACVHRVNEVAKRNWKQFMAPEITDMHSHIMPYPIVVDQAGDVTEAVKYFPDTKAPVRGAASYTLPDKLTL